MSAISDGNFAGSLTQRLGPHSYLIDAATGFSIKPAAVPGLVAASAAALLAAGMRPNDRVVVAGPLSPLTALVYLGAMYAGLVVVPVEERTLSTSAPSLIAATAARAVWTEQKMSLNFGQGQTPLLLDGDISRGQPATISATPRQNDDLAALMSTSGSTGAPRYVMVTHGNLLANTEAIVRRQGLQPDDRAMLVLPLSYCFGASVLHTHLFQGGGVVFDRRFMFPDKVLHAIAEHNCTTFAGVPTAYNVLLKRSKIRSIPLPSLRRMLQAGGAMSQPAIEEARQAVPQAKFLVMYGQTEATARITCQDPAFASEKPGSVGQPLDNLQLRILDDHGGELPPGQMGEIWVKGPSICAGYLNDPAETNAVFQNGWLRTRDLGHLDAEGFLWVHGRRGAFLKMRGLRISFIEAEARVAAVPGVLECAAQAVSHPEAGEALSLLVVLQPGASLNPDELRRSLPAHWAVDSIRFVAELPKTANNKLARSALPQVSAPASEHA